MINSMCEEGSVEYLRDLIKEKDNLDKKEDNDVLKKLLSQGKTLNNILNLSIVIFLALIFSTMFILQNGLKKNKHLWINLGDPSLTLSPICFFLLFDF